MTLLVIAFFNTRVQYKVYIYDVYVKLKLKKLDKLFILEYNNTKKSGDLL